MRNLRLMLMFSVFLMLFVATTAQPQAVPPTGSSFADIVNAPPPQWQKNLYLTAPANAAANWCCQSRSEITCNKAGVITEILNSHFAMRELTGSIPEGLGSFTSLHQLNLYSNQLSGTIPDRIGNLTNLQYLLPAELKLEESIRKKGSN
ncbi:hypothetical protein BDK51DRAFT_26476 [Blyttiomyces helicus]|uniref:Leucine-rich repeat-containing N-terminal plant-type domain-containing protein n=1 Tax=Blyttiomyces helicus TaxID=388810 RepID=A0A4P9W7H1_9FUNG|nr:hypothetical protein BDK51DRAFT_26476 [Blyttiomyces helicus]|eukprot:RKO86720.1 hypothetical protein BDK51DRAFT_26476 [Blyttiomyces helicus]